MLKPFFFKFSNRVGARIPLVWGGVVDSCARLRAWLRARLRARLCARLLFFRLEETVKKQPENKKNRKLSVFAL